MNRVWTYVISKPLTTEQLEQLNQNGKKFVAAWTAHDNKLSADFDIFGNKILVVTVDEDVANASGCSIDKLLRFIKESETKFGTELLNRFFIAYKTNEGVAVVHSSSVKELLAQNVISENTIIYNTAVSNDSEFKNWEQPLKNTWLNKYLVKA